MELFTNLKNKLRIRFGNPSPAELAVMSMPTAKEIREAECIADHPFAHPDVIGTRGPTTQSDEDHQMFSFIQFPRLGQVIQCEGEIGTSYQLWYVRTMELWAERKAELYRQAILDMSAESEEQLRAHQYRVDLIELWDGDRMREAKRVAASWRKYLPAFSKAYPQEAISAYLEATAPSRGGSSLSAAH